MARTMAALTITIFVGFLGAAAVRADDNSLVVKETVTFSDGSVGKVYDHCGDTDLCASIDYSNGDKLSIYSEGAAYCQPYFLDFVRTSGTNTVFSYSRGINHDPMKGSHCGRTQTTQMVMDRGFVHLTVFENSDGTLRLVFSKTAQGAKEAEPSAGPSTEPSPEPSSSP